jgi:hypothetical protein
MPTRMSWRPGREGATLYVYPETQRAEPGETATAQDGDASPADDDAAAPQDSPLDLERRVLKAS